MQKGIIKWFNPQKGYGFITGENGEEVFLHYSGLTEETDRKLYPGDSVEYKLSAGDKGPKAISVRRVK